MRVRNHNHHHHHFCATQSAVLPGHRLFLAQWAIMSVTVDDNPMENRYEARIDGAIVGASQYELTSVTIEFLQTVVAQEYEGQGIGSAIARYALDDARARGLKVRPLCPYIRAWLQRHGEYADLIRTPG